MYTISLVLDYPAFGFALESDVKSLVTTLRTEPTIAREAAQSNLGKVFAYLPLLINNIIIGIFRMVYAVGDYNEPMSVRVAHFVRGVMECLCMGPLLLLIDLVVTAVRKLAICIQESLPDDRDGYEKIS